MSKNKGPSRSLIKASNRKKHNHGRDAMQRRIKASEICLVVIDVPNVNVSRRTHYADNKISQAAGFEYDKFELACMRYLHNCHPDKFISLELVAFTNQRKNRNYDVLMELNDRPNWSVIRKPKIGDSDIDDDICSYVDFYIEEHPVMHVILVGNDLKNHIPVASSLVEQNIRATLACYYSQFLPSTKIHLKNIEGVDSFDIIKHLK